MPNLTFPMLWANSADDKLIFFFFHFPRKQDLTLHANCFLRRQFAWSVRPYFMGKIRKKNFKMSSAKIVTQHAKHWLLKLITFVCQLMHWISGVDINYDQRAQCCTCLFRELPSDQLDNVTELFEQSWVIIFQTLWACAYGLVNFFCPVSRRHTKYHLSWPFNYPLCSRNLSICL